MNIENLMRMAVLATTLVKQTVELVDQIADAAERSKDALSSEDLAALTAQLEQAHAASQSVSAELDAKLAKLANP